MPDDLVELQQRGPVGWITLNRPDALNARNAAMRTAIVESLDRFDADASVRVIALTGTGRAFSVGMDLKEAASAGAGTMPGPVDVERLASVRKPTIAAINGFALGGGCELALACDLRIASSDARLGLPEVRRGLLPGAGGTQRLPRLVGLAAAAWLVLLGEPVAAEEAARLGLVNRVVAPQDLLPAVQTLAESIAKGAPLALEAAKQALAASLEGTFESGLATERALTARLRATSDFREGAAAFKEKRDPNWQGR